MVVDYYFAFFMSTHQFAINRSEMIDAKIIEDVFDIYLEMTKSNGEVAVAWLLRIKRLIR